MNIQAAQAWMATKLQSTDGLTATYRRGSQSVGLTVTRGKSLLRLGDSMGGTKTELWDSDFFLKPSALVLNGVQTEPTIGDSIDVENESGTTQRFEVLEPGPNEACFRYVDNRTAIRVHTKQVRDL